MPNGLPIAAAPALDLRLLGFALGLTVATGLGFGALPALRAARGGRRWRPCAKGGAGSSARRERLRSLLVTVQVTLSVALLICTGLLLRALWQVQAVRIPASAPGGADPAHLAAHAPIRSRPPPSAVLPPGAVRGARPARRHRGRLHQLPAHGGARWDLAGHGAGRARARRGQRRQPALRDPGLLRHLAASPCGRAATSATPTRGEAPPVAVVSESFARRYWPGQNPIGRRFSMAFAERTVVGVVGDIRVRGLERTSEPQVYLSHQQVPDGGLVWYAPKDLVIRTRDRRQASAAGAAADRGHRRSAAADLGRADSWPRSWPPTPPRARPRSVCSAPSPPSPSLLAAIGIHGLLAFAVSSRTPGDRGAHGPGGRRRGTSCAWCWARACCWPGWASCWACCWPRRPAGPCRRCWPGSAPGTCSTFARRGGGLAGHDPGGQPAAGAAGGAGEPTHRDPDGMIRRSAMTSSHAR